MLVVPEIQAATCKGVRRSLSKGNPKVATFASNVRATGAARAIARRCASANLIGSYELYSPIVIRPRAIVRAHGDGAILNYSGVMDVAPCGCSTIQSTEAASRGSRDRPSWNGTSRASGT